MNFNALQEACWRFLGQHDAGNRIDWQRQEIRDAINRAQSEVHAAAPFLWNAVRETTLSIVNGTSDYALNDWCLRPLAFWTADSAAHKVLLRQPRIADRDGSRSTGLSFGALGPYEITLKPRTTTPALGTTILLPSSASTTEGSTTIIKTGGMQWTTALCVNRMLRLNGETEDYQVISLTDSNTAIIDRAFRGRLTGLGTTGVAANYAAVKWEIGPAGRMQITVLPAPTSSQTVYYRYIAAPRRLINADETPECPDEYHDLLWQGALRWLSALKEDDRGHQRFAVEYAASLETLRQRNADDLDSEDAPWFSTQLDDTGLALPRDVYLRDYRGF